MPLPILSFLWAYRATALELIIRVLEKAFSFLKTEEPASTKTSESSVVVQTFIVATTGYALRVVDLSLLAFLRLRYHRLQPDACLS